MLIKNIKGFPKLMGLPDKKDFQYVSEHQYDLTVERNIGHDLAIKQIGNVKICFDVDLIADIINEYCSSNRSKYAAKAIVSSIEKMIKGE